MAADTGHISLYIQTSPVKENNQLKFTGEYVDIIDATEEVTFNVEDEALKEAVQKYFGKRPTDVFLHSPTPWNDLYKTYNWEETKRHIKLENFNVKSFEVKDVLVQERIISNETDKPVVLNGIDIQGTTYSTAAIYWDITGKLMLFDEMDLAINLDDNKDSADKINIKVGWEKALSDVFEVVITENKPGDYEIKPKTKLVTSLFIKEVKSVYEVNFIANLSGIVAVKYDPKYKEHQFYGLNIDEVLKAVGNHNEVKAKLTVEVVSYPRSTGRVETHTINVTNDDEDISSEHCLDNEEPNFEIIEEDEIIINGITIDEFIAKVSLQTVNDMDKINEEREVQTSYEDKKLEEENIAPM